MSTQKPTPKKKSQSTSKKVAREATLGSPKKKAAASAVAGKKKPGPKKGSVRKVQAEKKTAVKKTTEKKVTAKKVAAKKPAIKKIGTDMPKNSTAFSKSSQFSPNRLDSAEFSSAIRTADELKAMADKYKKQIDKGSLNYLSNSLNNANPTSATNPAFTFAMDAVAKSSPKPAAKKKGIFSRVASWFKPSRKRK